MKTETEATMLNNQGVRSFMKQDFTEAEKHYKNAIASHKSNSTIYNNLGLLYHQKRDYLEAIEQFSKAIEIEEKDTYYLNLAHSLTFLQEHREAEKAYLKSLELNPRNGNAMISLARFYTYIGRVIKAEGIWEKLARQTGSNQMIEEWAKNLIVQKKYSKAHTLLTSIEGDDEKGSVSYYIGVCQFYLQNFGLANKAFKNALSKAPDNSSFRHFLAMSYLARGHVQEALRQINQLVLLFPEKNKYRLDRVAILLNLGEVKNLQEDLDLVLERDPNNEKARKYRAFIEKDTRSRASQSVD